MITKWSAKPADHKAARIRNNQRRHRERVKHHTTTLEARLAETQLQLDEALARVAELTEKLRLVGIPSAETTTINPTALHRSGGASSLEGGIRPSIREDEDKSIAAALLSAEAPRPIGESYDEIGESGERECAGLPPPGPDESTTRCRDAFKIIAGQNYSGLDLSAIRGRLRPGFRGSLVGVADDGGGCRVDNRLLFALLDFMSSA